MSLALELEDFLPGGFCLFLSLKPTNQPTKQTTNKQTVIGFLKQHFTLKNIEFSIAKLKKIYVSSYK